MNVFRYFGSLLLLCISQVILDVTCNTETHTGSNHVNRLAKESLSDTHRRKDVLQNDFNRKKIPHGKNQDVSFTSNFQKEQRSLNKNSQVIGKAVDNSTNPVVKDKAGKVTSKSTRNHPTHSKGTNLTRDTKAQAKKNGKKKMVVKKYSLFQSTNPLQSESENQPVMGFGQGFAMEDDQQENNDQAGEVRDQGFSLEGQQQQAMISEANPLSQYGTSQDVAGYQQENRQPSIANFAVSNSEDAAERGGDQPTSLGQAIQLQQAGYTQQSQEQEQDDENTGSDSQDGEQAGQGTQLMDSGQLQYQQGEQAGQGQDQSVQEQSDQEQNQNGLEPASFQQEQSQEVEQQQTQSIDQQQQDQTQEQQDQTQEFQQQEEQQQQQQSVEDQGSEGIPVESQALASSSNEYDGMFGADGQQTGADHQGQGTVSYVNEQSNEGAIKAVPPPGIQYASSIEEALKEPSVTPQESEEPNSQGGDGQESQSANYGTNVINIGQGTETKEEGNNGQLGVGTITAPSGYQASSVDDNGNPIHPQTENDINGYASMNDHATNGETDRLEDNQQPQSRPSENQNALSFAQEQFLTPGSEPKVPPLEDDVYKIINIANKNGPTADHVSVSDQESSPTECKDECHYNAKCINRECICKAGYTGDGLDCRPDTCLPGCKQHGKCIKGFCVCDHSHYFNGYECAPYTIRHKNCPLQCSTTCHARCPPNCCKHHPVMKLHYNNGNPQRINAPLNGLPSKPKNSPRPTEVMLKPIVKVGEAITNFAPEFQQRPGESDASNLEAVTLKEPTGGFSVSEAGAKPLLEQEGCPEQCKTECRDTCPIRCCFGKCPISCVQKCQPSCPKSCCHIAGTKNLFPMLDSKVQETFLKTMADRFCPTACKAKCDTKCPPICCEHNSSSMALTDANFQHLKSESKNSADFFRNAMSWFGMMNFLNMMYSMYGNLYNPKHKQFPLKNDDHKFKTFHPTNSKSIGPESQFKFKEVGVAEKPHDQVPQCPEHCNKTCLHPCPPHCCHDKANDAKAAKVSPPTKCLPSCSWFCSNSCPISCCSKDKKPLALENHATAPVKARNTSPLVPSQRSPDKPPAVCTSSCPAYCYPHCLENCCRRGELPSMKPTMAHDEAKDAYNNFYSKKPTSLSQDCPSICQNSCAPSCPVRCCAGSLSSPPTAAAKSPAKLNAPLCPGGCLSECFPACTISCCTSNLNKQNSGVRNPTENPTRRHKQPLSKTISFPLPPPIALCHSGCSRSCYPNCDETCCKASSEHVSRLEKPKQESTSPPFTIKVPCPLECRPFNCLYYCHHDCCLRGKQTTDTKKHRYQALSLQEKMKYLNGMRKKKSLESRFKSMHVSLDKRSEVRSGTSG